MPICETFYKYWLASSLSSLPPSRASKQHTLHQHLPRQPSRIYCPIQRHNSVAHSLFSKAQSQPLFILPITQRHTTSTCKETCNSSSTTAPRVLMVCDRQDRVLASLRERLGDSYLWLWRFEDGRRPTAMGVPVLNSVGNRIKGHEEERAKWWAGWRGGEVSP